MSEGSVIEIKVKGITIKIKSRDVLFYVGFLAASMLFGWLAQGSEAGSLLSYIFISLTIILMGIPLYIFFVCKIRVTKEAECPRCEGFRNGVFLSVILDALLVIIIYERSPPPLDDVWALMLLVIGFWMMIPAIAHGVYHRHYEKEFSIGDRAVSWVSGFAAGLAGLVIAFALLYLL